MLQFSLMQEAQKLRDLINEHPADSAILCNQEDLQQLPFRPNDLGFFMVLVPGQMHKETSNFSYVANQERRPAAQAFLTKHTVQQLCEGLLLVSTACSWDVVPDKVNDATALGFGAIAFTTPQRLQILGECQERMR